MLPLVLLSCHTAIGPSPFGSESASMSPAPSPSITNTPSISPTSSASPSASVPTKTVALYYIGKTESEFRLYREFRSIPVSEEIGLASLRYLVKRPSRAIDWDYINLWGNDSIINSVTYVGDTANVDLLVAPLNVGAEAEMRAIDQLVWTLTANHPTTKFVTFTSSGKQFESFAGHVDARQKFSRELAYEVLAPVWVNQVAKIMTNPVTMRGTACTFEAGLHWQLIRNGEMIREGSAIASGACPVRGAWTVELGVLRRGDYIFLAQDISPKDGTITQEDSKEFTIK